MKKILLLCSVLVGLNAISFDDVIAYAKNNGNISFRRHDGTCYYTYIKGYNAKFVTTNERNQIVNLETKDKNATDLTPPEKNIVGVLRWCSDNRGKDIAKIKAFIKHNNSTLVGKERPVFLNDMSIETTLLTFSKFENSTGPFSFLMGATPMPKHIKTQNNIYKEFGDTTK